ncbi:MAG TPA: hypothetical protein VFN42_04045, partial [Acetobacteraceae bacterium]|nr:hypothetical protein [Acetobacteraceae bacterium]
AGEGRPSTIFLARMLQSRGWQACARHDGVRCILTSQARSGDWSTLFFAGHDDETMAFARHDGGARVHDERPRA